MVSCQQAQVLVVVALFGFVGVLAPAFADVRSFGGYSCVDDCSEHAIGYLTAELRGFQNPKTCAQAPSVGQEEGCMVYFEDPYRGGTHDDDGREIVP
ncbi:MAG: hypothetical protein AAFV45_15760 [Pseudomonadota bacterium]